MSLLEKAREVESGRKSKFPKEEMVELALAFARGEVSLTQASHAIGVHSANAYAPLFSALSEEIRSGRIRIEVLK